jgi:hypothetical protein
MVTLYQNYTNEIDDENDILYPRNTINFEGVPATIKSAFESALKVKGIDKDICLLSLRRTLEAICKDKGASGNTLEKMIRDMIDKNILPQTFDDACWVIRQLGNEAAHAGKTNIYAHETDQVINFVESIIDYLYALPLRRSKLKNQVEKKSE